MQLQVTIEGNARYETLYIGTQAPGQAAPGMHPYYAQLEDSSKPMDRSPLVHRRHTGCGAQIAGSGEQVAAVFAPRRPGEPARQARPRNRPKPCDDGHAQGSQPARTDAAAPRSGHGARGPGERGALADPAAGRRNPGSGDASGRPRLRAAAARPARPRFRRAVHERRAPGERPGQLGIQPPGTARLRSPSSLRRSRLPGSRRPPPH